MEIKIYYKTVDIISILQRYDIERVYINLIVFYLNSKQDKIPENSYEYFLNNELIVKKFIEKIEELVSLDNNYYVYLNKIIQFLKSGKKMYINNQIINDILDVLHFEQCFINNKINLWFDNIEKLSINERVKLIDQAEYIVKIKKTLEERIYVSDHNEDYIEVIENNEYKGSIWVFSDLRFPDYCGMFLIKKSIFDILTKEGKETPINLIKGVIRYANIKKCKYIIVPHPLQGIVKTLEKIGFTTDKDNINPEIVKFVYPYMMSNYYYIGEVSKLNI